MVGYEQLSLPLRVWDETAFYGPKSYPILKDQLKQIPFVLAIAVLACNVFELILGQRIPKINLEDRTSDKPRLERSYVPCPHCETLYDSRTWSTKTGTGLKN